MTENPRLPIHAPTGSSLTARSWQTEAAMRMLQNNLDPEVAERPEELVVYGGTGKAARNWACFDAIVAALPGPGEDRFLAPEIDAASTFVKTGEAKRAAEEVTGELQ